LAFRGWARKESGFARRLALKPFEHSIKGLALGEPLWQRVEETVALSVGHELFVLSDGVDSQVALGRVGRDGRAA